MKRKLILAVILVLISPYTFAKENLAILPFTGGQGDEGETIAELFSFNDRLNDVFSPIPRTSITQAIRSEQRFQMNSGMTDADTIVAIGHQLGARYVVAGNITSIGNNKLLVISIIDIRNLQQVAGDYQTYTNMLDIRNKLPNMAGNIIQATQQNTASLPKLAVVPVLLQGGADQRDADTLTQILSIHLIRSGKYTVYPRTKSLEQVMEEHRIQFSGITADSNVIGVGFGENPNLVLSVVARKLDNVNMFNAAIIDILTGTQVVGRSVEYQNINDGMRTMETLAIALTSTTEQIVQGRQEEEDLQRREQAMDNFLNNFGLRLGLRFGFSIVNISDVGEPYGIEKSYTVDFETPLVAIMELRLGSYFSIQTEFQYVVLLSGFYLTDINSTWDSNLYSNDDTNGGFSFSIIQIPLLAKITFSPTPDFLIAPFAGIGFNIPIYDSNKKPDIISLPISGIFGLNVGYELEPGLLFIDLRYVHDFGEMTAEVTNTNSNLVFTGKRSSFDITFGVSFFIPFRKK